MKLFFCFVVLLTSLGWTPLASAQIPKGNWHLDLSTVPQTVGTGSGTIDISVTEKDSRPFLTFDFNRISAVSGQYGTLVSSQDSNGSFYLTDQNGGYYTSNANEYREFHFPDKDTNSNASVVVGVRFLQNGNIRFKLGDASWSVPPDQ